MPQNMTFPAAATPAKKVFEITSFAWEMSSILKSKLMQE